MYTVREINRPEELEPLRAQWQALLARTPEASFFQSLDWLEVYWSHFGGPQRLRVLVANEQETIVGIVPLVTRTLRRRFSSPRVLTYPLDDWGSFYGPIGPNPAATLTAALEHVARTPRDWDLIELAWVDASAIDHGATPQAMRGAGFCPLAECQQTCAIIDLAACGSWPSYWSSRTSRWRNNVRRSEKKLAELGAVSHLRYRPAGAAQGDGDPRWDLYDECVRIARVSWQGNSRTGTTLTHQAIRDFLRDCHARAAAAGAVDLNLLLVGDRPVAFNYAYHQADSVFGLRTGFDPGFEGAGSLLQARMIEDSFARGDRLYDLGPDYLAGKRYWQTATRPIFRYTHFAVGAPLAQLTRAKRTLARWLQDRRRSVVATKSASTG